MEWVNGWANDPVLCCIHSLVSTHGARRHEGKFNIHDLFNSRDNLFIHLFCMGQLLPSSSCRWAPIKSGYLLMRWNQPHTNLLCTAFVLSFQSWQKRSHLIHHFQTDPSRRRKVFSSRLGMNMLSRMGKAKAFVFEGFSSHKACVYPWTVKRWYMHSRLVTNHRRTCWIIYMAFYRIFNQVGVVSPNCCRPIFQAGRHPINDLLTSCFQVA